MRLLIERIIRRCLNEEYNHSEYLKWKRRNVTLRGIKQLGYDNGVFGSYGKGLYTTPLSNKSMAKTYGKLYYVLNAIPKNPKFVNSINDAEILIQKLISDYSKKNGREYDSRFFEENTSIEKEMVKLGYDGLVIKGREMVNYTPPNDVKYFATENQLMRYYADFFTQLNENNNVSDYNNIPVNIKKTLENEYGQYYMYNFDWNSKQDEFIKGGVFDGKGFNQWINDNVSEEFAKNLNKIIGYVRHDLILKLKQKNANIALNGFETLIIPVLGNEVLVGPISKFLETALLVIGSNNTDTNYINREMNKAFADAKNILDDDGSINYSKISPSTIFVGDTISLPKFERFAQKNPEYIGVFRDWKKLFDMDIKLSLIDLKAYRSSTTYSEIRELYDYLIKMK